MFEADELSLFKNRFHKKNGCQQKSEEGISNYVSNKRRD